MKLKESMEDLVNVAKEDQGVVSNVYASAIRDIKKAEEVKKKTTEIKKADELNEKPKRPEMNKGAKEMKLEKLILDESLFELKEDEEIDEIEESDIEDLIPLIDYNGAAYRGAEIPKADPFMINQINIPDNMRVKWFDVDKINDNTLQLTYVTQEEFDSEDSEKFIAEIKRFFEAILEREDYEKPLSIALDVECRDGEEYGKLVYDLDFNSTNEAIRTRRGIKKLSGLKDAD